MKGFTVIMCDTFSRNPTSRYEVLQLKKAMDEMLRKAGVEEEEEEIRGLTAMHNLLELIKKEQDIYNIVFHELIRQVSILHTCIYP